MSIVSWCGDGDGSCTSNIGVTKLERQLLQFVGVEAVIIPKDMVMAWPRCPLNALMRAQIKVKFCGMGDADVHCGTSRDVARTARLLARISAEQSSVVTLLNHDKSDARFVVWLQFDAGLANCRQFVLQNLQKLTFGHTIPDNSLVLVFLIIEIFKFETYRYIITL